MWFLEDDGDDYSAGHAINDITFVVSVVALACIACAAVLAWAGML